MQNANAAEAFHRAMTLVVSILMSGALAASVAVPAFATLSSEHELKAREYEQSAADKKAEAAEIRSSIDELQTRINEAQAAYEAALAEHDAATAAVEDAQRRMVAAEERIDELQGHLGDRAITMYKSGGETSIMSVLLGSQSFESFLKSWDTIKRIADQDATWIQETKDARIASYEASVVAREQQALAKQKTEEAEAARQEVLSSQLAMEATLELVNEEIATLDALQEEEAMAAEEARRLEEQAARLAREKFNIASSSITADGWVHPLPGAVVSSEYGSRVDPITGQASTYHSGIDLAAPLGTPVGAAKAGTVSYVGWYGTGGNAVIVNHGDGVRTVYMHLNGFNTYVGAQVQPGDCIAYVGTTGRSTGPHLHFNVEINTTPINPRTVLSF